MRVNKYRNKERLAWRGKKQRYSVFKARHNRMWETIHERMVLQICKDNGLRFEDYFKDDKRVPWETTYDYLTKELGYRMRTKSIQEMCSPIMDELPPLEK